MEAGRTMTSDVKNPSAPYEVERLTYRAARPGFRIAELQISPTQQVPWHYHNNVHGTFYMVEGEIRSFLQQPRKMCGWHVGKRFASPPNAHTTSSTAGLLRRSYLFYRGPA